MIEGIGCDILHIDRVCRLLKYESFLGKYFTQDEIKLFMKYENNEKNYFKKIASNLCVKESFFKAISSKIKDFRFCDVEVLRDLEGRPYISLYNKLDFLVRDFKVHVTITNERNVVSSFVIIEKII